MTPKFWTSDDLHRFGEGVLVSARDGQGKTAPLPADLDLTSIDSQGLSSRTDLVHQADRGAVARAWLESTSRPGEVVEVACRAKVGESWHRMRIGYLNLLEQPDIGVILIRVGYEGILSKEEAEEAEETSEESEAPTWVIIYLGRVGEILDVIGMPEELFGRSSQEMVGRTVLDFIHPDDHAVTLATGMELTTNKGATRTLRQRALRSDGSIIWIESTVVNTGGLDETLMCVTHDISAKRAQEEELRTSREEFRLLAEEIPAAAFRADSSGRVLFGNARWIEFVANCGSVESIQEIVDSRDRPAFDEWWEQMVHLEAGGQTTTEFRCSDQERTVSLGCTVVSVSQSGVVVLGVLHDVTDKAELRHQAEHDSLTGLMNRRSLEFHMAGATAEVAAGGSSTVLFLDIDGFKAINDTYGHAAGDHLLQEIALRLKKVFRPGDAIARVGGDEFVVVCTDCDLAEAGALRDRLGGVMAAPVEYEGFSWSPRLSVGVAAIEIGDDAQSVLRRADADMYQSKRATGS